MANRWYGKGKEHAALGDWSWTANTIKLIFLAAGYTPNFSTHEFVSDLTNIVARSAALGTKANLLGVLNAAAAIASAVSGSNITQIVAVKDTGVDATSLLLLYWDTATGFPIIPNGGDITVNFDTGANKVAVI